MAAMQLLYVLKCGSGKRKKIDGVRAVRLFNIILIIGIFIIVLFIIKTVKASCDFSEIFICLRTIKIATENTAHLKDIILLGSFKRNSGFTVFAHQITSAV